MSSILKVDTIQNTGGTSGLTIDSNGFVLPKAVAFSAYMSGTQSISASTWTKVTFNTEEYDTASQYDHSNSKFQPTIAGYYQINAALAWMDGASTAGLSRFYKNGSNYKNSAYLYHGSQSLDDYQVESSVLIHMNGSSDYLEIYAFNVGTANTISGGTTQSYFQGFLVGV